jgi:pyruvate-formate lyase-activating enzyme
MATITNSEMTITTNRPEDRATVIVNCDVEFTEVEVNAMNLLGLQYTLECRVLNKELLDEEPVVTYIHQVFPRVAGMARRYERVTFDTYQPMYLLHDRLIGKDKLMAELKLKNEETGGEVVERTEVVAVDLAA